MTKGALASPFDIQDVPEIAIPRLPVPNFMPPEGESFEDHAYIAIPAVGATAVVLSRQVPIGRNGMIKRLANVFVGGGFQEGQGNLIWQIMLDLKDPSFGAGANNLVAPFYDNIVASLGSVSAPSSIDGIRVREGQTYALVVRNVAVVVAGQLIGGRLGGYFYPIDLEPPNMGF